MVAVEFWFISNKIPLLGGLIEFLGKHSAVSRQLSANALRARCLDAKREWGKPPQVGAASLLEVLLNERGKHSFNLSSLAERPGIHSLWL
uniref:Uncharacterized protein n=1 Tax=Moorena producens (strain JHB) TaxID=1454205 RepID=A0A1D9FZE3_MOOP1